MLDGHTAEFWSVSPAPNGRHVGTAGKDKTARVWDGETGKVAQICLVVHRAQGRQVHLLHRHRQPLGGGGAQI